MHNRAFVGKKGARHASFCQFYGAIAVHTCLEPLTAFHMRKNRSHMSSLLYVLNVNTAICDWISLQNRDRKNLPLCHQAPQHVTYCEVAVSLSPCSLIGTRGEMTVSRRGMRPRPPNPWITFNLMNVGVGLNLPQDWNFFFVCLFSPGKGLKA